MKRWFILAAAVLMQMGLGATYSWSVYVDHLRALTGMGQGLVQLPFTAFYMVFPATVIAGGVLVGRWGPRVCAVMGGVLFGAGWLLASQGGRHFGFTLAGIGVLAGVGVGLAYIVPIAVGVRWFPERKGLVTGVAVAGFGGGAAILSEVGHELLDLGRTPFEVFGILGMAFVLIVPLAGLMMQFPPDASNTPDKSDLSEKKAPAISFSALLAHREFRLLYFAMAAGLAGGFAVNANLKDLAPAGSVARLGALAVSLFAVANALGRVLWGYASDHSRRPAVILCLNLTAQAAILLTVVILALLRGRSAPGYLVFAALAGFNYGGVLVLYAATAARIWGAMRLSKVYGLLFSSNIPAALAPLLAGFVFDATGAFTPALALLAVLLLAAALKVRGVVTPRA